MNDNILSIERKDFNGKIVLYFTFHGLFSAQAALEGVETWKCYTKKSSVPFTIIWNCKDMSNYEPMARVYWQKAMTDMKETIDDIWLISNSALIRTGAKVLSLFTAFEINSVKEENEIAFPQSRATA